MRIKGFVFNYHKTQSRLRRPRGYSTIVIDSRSRARLSAITIALTFGLVSRLRLYSHEGQSIVHHLIDLTKLILPLTG